MTASPAALPPASRDLRLDFFRGLCLVMIFVNHVPGQIYETWTSRNFGFTDAAEGFVFMSGAAAGLAYSRGMRRRPLWPTLSRIWGRVWLLYMVQMTIAAAGVAIAAAVLRFGGVDLLMERANMQWFGLDPLGFLIGLPALTHQLGYVNILPMYMVLLFAAPAMIRAAQWRMGVFLGALFALWAVAAQFRIDLPNFPSPGGWFFNPLAWAVVFGLGLATGVRLKDGRRLVPVRWWLVLPALGFVLFVLVWKKTPPLEAWMNERMAWIGAHGAPWWVVAHDKTYVSAPRLLHLMALAYVLSLPGPVRRLCGSALARPVVMLGRNALPVFALGTVLSFAAQAVKALDTLSLAEDTALILTGLGLQWALAAARDRHKAALAAAPRPGAPAA